MVSITVISKIFHVSMTIVAIFMALCSPVYHALAAATRVSPSLEMNIIDIPHEP